MVNHNDGWQFVWKLYVYIYFLFFLRNSASHCNLFYNTCADSQLFPSGELLVIVEFCCFGNLQNYLLRHRQNFIDQVVGDAIDPTKGAELVARAVAEDRKAREAHEESTR